VLIGGVPDDVLRFQKLSDTSTHGAARSGMVKIWERFVFPNTCGYLARLGYDLNADVT
jgi:hypothetical protein